MTDVSGPTATPAPGSVTDPDVGAVRLDPADDDRVPTQDLGAAAIGGTPVGGERRDPVEAVKDPDNRAKLLLAIGVLSLLNFLLLLGVLASLSGGPDQIMVDGRPCIVDERDGEGVLFCQQ